MKLTFLRTLGIIFFMEKTKSLSTSTESSFDVEHNEHSDIHHGFSEHEGSSSVHDEYIVPKWNFNEIYN